MNGKIFNAEVGYGAVASSTHPCVFKTYKAKAAQGTLPGGMLVALDADSKLVPYNRAGAAPLNVLKGVLSRPIDTTVDDAAIVIIHGTVNSSLLCYGAAGDLVTAADLAALEAMTVYPQ
jgi:hypothetical protein